MTALWRGSKLQKARLLSGLVLFVFATTHFLNHALGLVSLDAMNAFDSWRVAVIRSVPGTLILVAALLAHIGLALLAVLRRRTLRIPLGEAAQIGLGLLIPLFLLPHIAGTRVAHDFFGVQDTYRYVLAQIWPDRMLGQTVLMLLVWIHGCIGLHHWLRLSPGYLRVAPILLSAAVLLPFAAFTGISTQGRMVRTALSDPAALRAFKAESRSPSPADLSNIETTRDRAVDAFTALLVAAGAFATGRFVVKRRAMRIVISYPGGQSVTSEPGPSLLEISRRHAIPHMAVCGGRGRCSTCRVVVLRGHDELEPPTLLERSTLDAIQAGPRVRLACQVRPRANLTVAPILKPDRAAGFALQTGVETQAPVERDLAVLFVDMRGFTSMTERKLAFDVVFILNRFFTAVGKPVYDQGGWITNYAGDGLIALFSDASGIGGACRAALVAAAEIDAAVAVLNRTLGRELPQPIAVAMGLHAGPHVIGRIGYAEAQSQSVIGLAVNVASRMEALAKSGGVQLVASRTAADHAGLDTTGLRVEAVDVRGLAQPVDVVFIPEARMIASRLLDPQADASPASRTALAR